MYQHERSYFESLAASVRILLRRETLTPQQVVSLGHLLQALHILPLVDSAISVSISLYPNPDSDGLDLNLSIGDDELERAVIERLDGPQGAEAICHPVASFSVSGERTFGDQWSPGYWLREWEEAVSSNESRLEIVDNSDADGIDWELVRVPNDFLEDESPDE